MAKQLIHAVRPHVKLYRDPETGIAWVEDGETGCGHSAHPNIDRTGNARKVYGRNARLVECRRWVYNTDVVVVTDELDELARQHCRCGGRH